MIELNIKLKEGLEPGWCEQFFEAINLTSMKRSDFTLFKKAYESRSLVLSLWDHADNSKPVLVGFATLLTDWAMNSVVYDVVVCQAYQKQGFGKKLMEELMERVPGTRIYLTSTFGHEEFYKKLGFKKHKTAYALYPSYSPYLENEVIV